jgi:outer membrane protein TolC
LEAARATEAVGRSAAAQARESHRIVRDRYEGGLADVSALLRAAEVVQQADARQAAARVDVVLATAELNRAVGKR